MKREDTWKFCSAGIYWSNGYVRVKRSHWILQTFIWDPSNGKYRSKHQALEIGLHPEIKDKTESKQNINFKQNIKLRVTDSRRSSKLTASQHKIQYS